MQTPDAVDQSEDRRKKGDVCVMRRIEASGYFAKEVLPREL